MSNETRYQLRFLRDWRELRGLSQSKLATAANTTKATIVRLEKGQHEANGTTASRLALALGIRRDDLVNHAPAEQNEAPTVATSRRNASAEPTQPTPAQTA